MNAPVAVNVPPAIPQAYEVQVTSRAGHDQDVPDCSGCDRIEGTRWRRPTPSAPRSPSSLFARPRNSRGFAATSAWPAISPGRTTCARASRRHDELRDMCSAWQAEGKIVITGLSSGQAFVNMSLGG